MSSPASSTHCRERGSALLVVLVFTMLCLLLTVWAARTALFNEMVVGNDADWQRAFEAAQTLLQDAELDIRGQMPNGTPCSGPAPLCRQGQRQIPTEESDVPILIGQLLAANSTGCQHGLCAKRLDPQDFWNDPSPETGWNAMRAHGVRYGSYTGAATGNPNRPANPILYSSDSQRGAWYWIEVLPYLPAPDNSAILATGAEGQHFFPLNAAPKVIYRITAIAYGLKENTRVVLQQTYARQRLTDEKLNKHHNS